MSQIINATYVTNWDDYKKTIEVDCKINLDTGAVFDIGSADAKGVENLDDEYVSYGAFDLSLKNDGISPVLVDTSLLALRESIKLSPERRVKL